MEPSNYSSTAAPPVCNNEGDGLGSRSTVMVWPPDTNILAFDTGLLCVGVAAAVYAMLWVSCSLAET